MATHKESSSHLEGALWLSDSQRTAFAAEQVQLLAAIDRCGSISGAAKAVGISYKTAWDRVEAINNLAERPLVQRTAGGSRGGGTSLTDYGRQVVAGFATMQAEHETFLQRLGSKVQSLNDLADFLKVGTVNTSARNQYRGTVTAIETGAVNTVITLQITDPQTIACVITEDSRRQLDLKIGDVAIALIKSSWVMLSTELDPAISARNKLRGTIARMDTGAVNTDVVVDLGEGKSISAMITNASADELVLETGQQVCAFFKASSVILVASS